MTFLPLKHWPIQFNKPLIIAGPCSAESQTQVLNTAHALKKTKKVQIFRAGIWKPRTRPNCFEGVGQKGLPWLTQVKKETGLLTSIEVAKANHVELALKHNVDILWIGARTTVSPFAVQEIVEALKGTDQMVMVKNPVNHDLNLWMGAFERLSNGGIKKAMAIHRGFSSDKKGKYRNTPSWQIPYQLREQIPGIPIICDPSHMAGKREFLKEISQKAFDLNMDGLMIESHIDPDSALSDAQQQVTPKDLHHLLDDLSPPSNRPHPSKDLDLLREEIDPLDQNLLEILGERMNIVKKIALDKKKHKKNPLQKQRIEKIIQSRIMSGAQLGLKEEYIRNIYQVIHNESVARQSEIINATKMI